MNLIVWKHFHFLLTVLLFRTRKLFSPRYPHIFLCDLSNLSERFNVAYHSTKTFLWRRWTTFSRLCWIIFLHCPKCLRPLSEKKSNRDFNVFSPEWSPKHVDCNFDKKTGNFLSQALTFLIKSEKNWISKKFWSNLLFLKVLKWIWRVQFFRPSEKTVVRIPETFFSQTRRKNKKTELFEETFSTLHTRTMFWQFCWRLKFFAKSPKFFLQGPQFIRLGSEKSVNS